MSAYHYPFVAVAQGGGGGQSYRSGKHEACTQLRREDEHSTGCVDVEGYIDDTGTPCVCITAHRDGQRRTFYDGPLEGAYREPTP